MCVSLCIGFPTPTRRSPTPAGCLRTQLSSDAVDWETASDPNGLRALSHETVPHFGCQSQVQGVTGASDQRAVNEVPMTPVSGLVSFPDRLLGLGKPVRSLGHWFITEDVKRGASPAR